VILQKLDVPDDITEENVKAKEQACYKLAAIYREQGKMQELIQLQKNILPLFADMPKSKTGKIIRTLFDISTRMEGRFQDLVDLSKVIIEWCEKESRSFLRMRIENKLADLYFKLEKYTNALEILKKLLAELKKKEDKQLMVEAQLIESKVYHALENLPKAKAALTSVKTAANSIYVVPLLQAEIDMMSGLIACDEKDYTTAYSYFYETFEGYRSMNEQVLAANAFKFMTFSKIMNRQSQDCLSLISSSMALKF
jgi:26S proteasome regulatory subunit N6